MPFGAHDNNKLIITLERDLDYCTHSVVGNIFYLFYQWILQSRRMLPRLLG
jgi:hypothetical protein